LRVCLTSANPVVIPPSGLDLRHRRVVGLISALAVWYGLAAWAATVSTQAFGRYEIVLQEGIPVAIGEILGLVRRQTGLPEYPLTVAVRKGALELSILGPGNRPIPLASAPFNGPTGVRAPAPRFTVEHSARQGETLTLRLRQRRSPAQVSFAVDLRHLERMLEGER
jgi:hypothetical protein